jgi:putative endonuclease
MTFHTYILRSTTTGRFYVGHIGNLQKRLFEHNNNRTRSTQNRGPWELFHSEEYATKVQASRREREIKRMKSRKWIEDLARASR